MFGAEAVKVQPDIQSLCYLTLIETKRVQGRPLLSTRSFPPPAWADQLYSQAVKMGALNDLESSHKHLDLLVNEMAGDLGTDDRARTTV